MSNEDETTPEEGTSKIAPATLGEQIFSKAAVLLLIGVAAGFLSVVTVLPGMFLGQIFVHLAIPYTIIATVFAVRNRRKAAARVEAGDYQPGTNLDVENFRTRWQRSTLALNILLAPVFLAMVFTVGRWVEGRKPGVFVDASNDMVLIGASVLAAIFGCMMIAYNTHFIYMSKDLLAEAHALAQKGEAAAYIKATRVWSWITWFSFSGIALYMLANNATSFV